MGADGVLVLLPSSGAMARMVVHNADGSIAEMCGNGIRCAVKFMVDLLDEAQELSDRVAIIKEGRILAIGTPAELGVGTAQRVRVTWRGEDGELHEREVDDPTQLVHDLTAEALARGESVRDLTVVRPSLEDVYLELTADEQEEAVGV